MGFALLIAAFKSSTEACDREQVLLRKGFESQRVKFSQQDTHHHVGVSRYLVSHINTTRHQLTSRPGVDGQDHTGSLSDT